MSGVFRKARKTMQKPTELTLFPIKVLMGEALSPEALVDLQQATGMS